MRGQRRLVCPALDDAKKVGLGEVERVGVVEAAPPRKRSISVADVKRVDRSRSLMLE